MKTISLDLKLPSYTEIEKTLKDLEREAEEALRKAARERKGEERFEVTMYDFKVIYSFKISEYGYQADALLYRGNSLIDHRISGGNSLDFTTEYNIYHVYTDIFAKAIYDSVRNDVCNSAREYVEDQLRQMAWSTPFGLLHLPAIEPADIAKECALHGYAEKYINTLIFYGPTRGDKTPDGRYIIYRPTSFRAVGPVILVDSRLAGKETVGVRVEKSVKGTAWKILPGGNYVVLHIVGNYMTRGRWAPEYSGIYMPKLYNEEIEKIGGIILWSYCGRSGGGGLGGCTHLIAVPTSIQKPIPIGEVEVAETAKQIGRYVMYSNGLMLPSDIES